VITTARKDNKNLTCCVLVAMSPYVTSMFEFVVFTIILTMTSACWLTKPERTQDHFDEYHWPRLWQNILETWKSYLTTLLKQSDHCMSVKE